jgi:hypothetical protein
MSTPTPIPPIARDFLAYQRILIDQASTRQVAAELQISQTRVRQIVRRLTDWLLQNLPPTDENLEAARLRLAQCIAADRLDRYLREADQAWRQTHETKYANLALRLLTAQSKSAALPGTLEALAADAILGPLPDDTSSLYTATTSQKSDLKSEICNLKSEIPPVRDCSPSSTTSLPIAPIAAPPVAPNPLPQTPSNDRSASASAARKAFLAPAHFADGKASAHPLNELSAAAAPIAELKITPQKLTFHPNQPLSRRERRRRERLTRKTPQFDANLHD